MRKCCSAWNLPKTIPAESGDGLRQNYTVLHTEQGTVLKKAEIIDEYEQIQSHRDDCELAKIIAMNGTPNDDMGYFANPDEYGEMSTQPFTLQESINEIATAKCKWESLPSETRKEFGDFSSWIAEVGSEEWLNKMGIKEVKVDELGSGDAVHGSAENIESEKQV